MKSLLAMLFYILPSYILTAQQASSAQVGQQTSSTPADQISSAQVTQPASSTQAAQHAPYDQYPVYTGKDLGLTYSKAGSRFRIWSPTATQAQLLLYAADSPQRKSSAAPTESTGSHGTITSSPTAIAGSP